MVRVAPEIEREMRNDPAWARMIEEALDNVKVGIMAHVLLCDSEEEKAMATQACDRISKCQAHEKGKVIMHVLGTACGNMGSLIHAVNSFKKEMFEDLETAYWEMRDPGKAVLFDADSRPREEK
jgi:hypothetical protein